MALWVRQGFVEDRWTRLADGEAGGAAADAVADVILAAAVATLAAADAIAGSN